MVLRGRSVLTAAVVASASLAVGLGLVHQVRAQDQRPRTPSVLWQVTTTAPEVALTFDDGPSPVYTPPILAALSAYHAHATFFVLGSLAAQYPEVVRQEKAQGSQVCNHGFSHIMLVHRSAPVVTDQVQETARILRSIGVPDCRLFRFPYFASDVTARTTVQRLGYLMIGANVDTEDWKGRSPAAIAATALQDIEPGDIILMHDAGGTRTPTVQAVTLVLKGLQERKLRAVTVGQLLASAEIHPPTVSR